MFNRILALVRTGWRVTTEAHTTVWVWGLVGLPPAAILWQYWEDISSHPFLWVIGALLIWAALFLCALAYEGKTAKKEITGSTSEPAPLRIGLTSVMQRVFEHPKKFDLNVLAQDIRQAGYDQEIRFWGRPQRNRLEELNRNEPLLDIPRDHWIDFEISVMDLFKYNRKGEIQRAHDDNIHAFTYTFKRGSSPVKGFVDLHVHRADAEAFLIKHGVT